MLTEKQLSCMHRCQGWVLGISSNGDDRTGAKIKTKKIPQGLKQNPKKIPGPKINQPKNPMPNFRALKLPRKLNTPKSGCTLFEELRWLGNASTDLESSDCFEYPKILLLKSTNYFRIFLPEKFMNRKFQSQKILRPSPSLEIESVPPRASLLHKINISHVLSQCRRLTLKSTRLRRNDNVTNVIHWDLAGKCGFADRKNVKIKVLQVLRRCAGEESRLH